MIAMIFLFQNGHYQLDNSFITGNSQIKCDADFDSKVYDKVILIFTYLYFACNPFIL
jgi:hypothetical protein